MQASVGRSGRNGSYTSLRSSIFAIDASIFDARDVSPVRTLRERNLHAIRKGIVSLTVTDKESDRG